MTSSTIQASPTRRWLSALGRWAFVAPVLILNLIVVVIPSVAGLAVAFTDWSGIGAAHYIGLENFERLFEDDVFFKAIKNNLIWTVMFLTIPVSLGLLGAYMLSGIKRGQMVFRIVYFTCYSLKTLITYLNLALFKAPV